MQNSRELGLLNQIKDLQNQLKILKKQKKYGLVWEEKEEKIDKNNLPIFVENTDLRIHENEENPINLIIEWDNFHTLSALQYTHFGKIDVIYIDPPYNTGNKDFVYNDNYVDKEDTFRHSKWLSFMEKRLKLARNLLKNDGVIFISIDDNEFAQLKLLCDEVFWNDNLVANFIRNIPDWNNIGKISITHEYLLCYKKWIIDFNIEKDTDDMIDTRLTKRWNSKSVIKFPKWLKSIFIENKNFSWIIGWKSEPIKIIWEMIFEKWYLVNDIELEAEWSMPWVLKELFEWKRVFDKKWQEYTLPYFTSTGVPHLWKVRESWIFRSIQIWNNATNEVNNIFHWEQVFNNPKTLEMMKKILKISSKPNSIILDFFAWSGTTWHAVMELNKEDGWNRQFILCSNTEATKENPEKNICKNITYERNKRVITGYTNAKWEKIEWLGWNLRYYKTEFISKNSEKSLDDLRYSFMQKCDDLLCIKEDIFTKIEKNDFPETIKIFKRKNKFLLVCYDISHFEKLSKILKIFDKTEKVAVYIFTLKNDIIAEFDNLGTNISIKNIPDEILETYKKIFFK